MRGKKRTASGRRKGSSPPWGRPPVAGGHGDKRHFHRFSYEAKRKSVRLYLEEGMPAEVVAKEVGTCKGTIFDWVRNYRLNGEEGLKPKPTVHRTLNAPTAVAAKITEIKKHNPSFGVRRISQILRRIFMLPASHETVRRTLHREKLIVPLKKKPQKNPQKPRFFERSTPNQMWQSDIFCFRLGGENAYLLGFIDDFSRYITGLGVYRSQTADNLLEVYRRARGEYRAPKEMLTDNGRQYTNWRGKTAFEKEMGKDRIHHFRSSPHHPQTLGKIERFWKSIWEEFLSRARFDSFESAQDRIAYWVKYYNHKRPHQGIGGMCPADRFFEIRKEVKEAIEKGIEANVQDLALRGKVQSPFYMVGRMGEKSVVISADRGQVKMQVEGEEERLIGGIGNDNDTGKGSEEAQKSVQRTGEGGSGFVGVELTAEAGGGVQEPWDSVGTAEQLGEGGARGDTEIAGAGIASGNGGAAAGDQVGAAAEYAGGGESGSEGRMNDEQTQRDGQVPGGSGGMGGETESGRSMPGDGDRHEPVLPVAGDGNGGYAGSVGTEVERGLERAGNAAEVEKTDGAEDRGEGGTTAETGEAAVATGGSGEAAGLKTGGELDGRKAMGGEDRPGAERPADGDGSSAATWGEPQDVLQEGKPGAVRPDGGTQGPGERATGDGGRPGEGAAP